MPPRSESADTTFWQCVEKLSSFKPDFLSITYGAGGNDRGTGLDALSKIVQDTPILPMAHIICIDTPRDNVESLANEFLREGVRMFLALRGDPPVNSDRTVNGGSPALNTDMGADMVQDTAQLTYLLRALDKRRQRESSANKFKTIMRPLIISVAAFPGGNPALGTTPSEEVDRLLEKQDAGADFAISQLYYDPKVFDDFMTLARKRGVSIPVIAGVSPIWSIERIEKCEKYIGVKGDSTFMRLLSNAWSDEEREKIGLDFWQKMCIEATNSGAPGVHFFTFNNANNSVKLTEYLGDF